MKQIQKKSHLNRDSLLESHVGERPVERDEVAGHQVELVLLELVQHHLLLLCRDDHRFTCNLSLIVVVFPKAGDRASAGLRSIEVLLFYYCFFY